MKKTERIIMYTAVVASIGALLMLLSCFAPALAVYGCGIVFLCVIALSFLFGRTVTPGGVFNSDRLFSIVILFFLAFLGDIAWRLMFTEEYFNLSAISWRVSIGPAAFLIGYLTLLYQKRRKKDSPVLCL